MSKYDVEEMLQDELVEDVEVSDEELLEAAAKLAEEDDEEDEDEDEEEMEEGVEDDSLAAANATTASVKASAKKKQKPLPKGASVKEDAFSEDLDALVEGEATLSEQFRDKAGVIFEAALKSKLAEHVERLEESYAEQLEEQTSAIKTELVEKVDSYLNYVVESWMEENKLAVETGLRSEISESFMDALHGVFADHYVTVPEGKADLVEELAQQVEALEESYNAKVEEAMELSEAVAELTREKIIIEATEGLSEVQAEKFKSLVEDVEFKSEESFLKKVETIKESYFKAKAVAVAQEEELNEATEEKVVDSRMSAYLAAIKKSH